MEFDSIPRVESRVFSGFDIFCVLCVAQAVKNIAISANIASFIKHPLKKINADFSFDLLKIGELF